MLSRSGRSGLFDDEVPEPAAARDPEAGAALLLVMVFILVVFVVVTSLLTFGEAGTRSAAAFRTQRTIRYAADGALEQGVAAIANDPTLGFGVPLPASPTCSSLTVPILDPSTTPTIAANSVLSVSACATNPTSGVTDPDGGTGMRDVTFTVTCNATKTGSAHEILGCTASGGTARTVATARVQFGVDYMWTGAVGSATPAASRDHVPKIISWNVTA